MRPFTRSGPGGLGHGQSGRRLRELVVLSSVALVVFVVASRLDLFEASTDWLRGHEDADLDEVVLAALATVVAMAAYSRRRYREARSEVLRRDLAERALAETVQRSRSLFQYHPHAAYSLDLEGRFVDVNPASERLTGYSEAELRGMDSTALSAPDDADMARATLEDIAVRRARTFDTTVVNKLGNAVELRVTSLPIVVDDQVVGMYGVAEDVTAANQMQRDLETARAAAEQASEAKSLFLANVSHELRTPLTSVLAASELLEDTDLSQQQLRLLSSIERSGQRLLRLVNDILDFSRIEAGKTDVEIVEFDLRSLLADLAESVRGTAEGKGLDFEFGAEPAVPATMQSDPTRLFQVLANLLDNAVKFTDSGSVELQVTDPDGRGDRICFTVTDTGIGLSAGQVGGLFQSFSQADASITRRYGGTGLGLAICKELVTLMGGDIEVDSVEGSGSSFAVVLPRHAPSSSSDTESAVTRIESS
jgi:PAS domain S-box-containing protein